MDVLPGRDHFVGPITRKFGEFAHVDEPHDLCPVELGERAVLDNAGDRGGGDGSDLDRQVGVGLQLSEGQTDPSFGAIELDDDSFDGVPHVHDATERTDRSPGHLGAVEQCPHAPDVDSNAIVDELDHGAGHTPTDRERGEHVALNLASLPSQEVASRHHHAVLGAIDLGHQNGDLLAHQSRRIDGVRVVGTGLADHRSRQERSKSEVDDEPALDGLRDRAGQRFTARQRFLDTLPPCALERPHPAKHPPLSRIVSREQCRLQRTARRGHRLIAEVRARDHAGSTVGELDLDLCGGCTDDLDSHDPTDSDR